MIRADSDAGLTAVDTTGAQPRAAAEWVDPATLKPWAKNPRKNDGEPVDKVAESIQRFGFGAPIVARLANREIIAGHTRWKAAKKLGLARVPVRYLDVSEDDAHKLALADNKLAELAEWDRDVLHTELAQYDELVRSQLGWTAQEYAVLSRGRGAADDDDAPELSDDAVTQLGDTWALGQHTLICGDGRETPARKHGCVVTDPPYGVSIVNRRGQVGGRGDTTKSRPDLHAWKAGTYPPIAGDDSTPDVRWLVERGEVAIIWGGMYFADQLPAESGWLVWDKRDASGIENRFADAELAWSNRGGVPRIHRQLWNGLIRAGEREKRVHPAQKPVELMLFCLGFTTGDVFDPYAGSGTTLIAATKLDRVCTAVELSPAYCDVIIERWQQVSGEKARKVSP